MRVSALVGLGLWALSAACGADDSTPTDGGDGGSDTDAPDGGTFTLAPPEAPRAEPAAPAVPQLAPCPTGWREVPPPTAGGPATCDPWPATGHAACGVGQAHFPGEPGCTPVGAACPAGDWPEGLPADAEVVYVKAGAAAGGDGTSASPFATVAAGLAAASSGTIVALAKGRYDEAVAVPTGVTLWGACAAETAVGSSTPEDWQASILVRARAVTLRNLRITGNRVGLTVSGAVATADLQGVTIEAAAEAGVNLLTSGRLTANGLLVRGTRARPSDSRFGQGLWLEDGAQAEIARAAFEGNAGAAAYLMNAGTNLTLRDVVLRDTEGAADDGEDGQGLVLADGAQATVERAAVENNRTHAVLVFGDGSHLTLRDGVVRNTRAETATGRFGRGIEVQNGGAAQVERSLVERNLETAINSWINTTSLALTDVVVRDTSSNPTGADDGTGVNVGDLATATFARLWLENNQETGLTVGDPGAVAQATDLTVVGTRVNAGAREGGYGLQLDGGGSLTAVRAAFERNRGAGIVVLGEGTTGTFEDLAVRETDVDEGSDPALRGGYGINVSGGAQLQVARAVLERNRDLGLFAEGPGTRATLTDLAVRDTRGDAPDLPGWLSGGRGLTAQNGAEVRLERAVFERNRDVAIIGSNPGVRLFLTDVRVSDTASRTGDGQGGTGLHLQTGATAEVTRGVFERNREGGILALDEGAAVVLADVVVRDTESQEADGRFGRGLGVFYGADASGARVRLENNRDLGLIAFGPGSELRLEDAEVLATRERACAADTCPGLGAGTGAGSFGGAHIELTRFVVADHALAGVQIAAGTDPATGASYPDHGTVDLHHGVVSGNPMGANVQDPEFNLDRLMDDVLFVDNDRNLDATVLPVPEPGEHLPSGE